MCQCARGGRCAFRLSHSSHSPSHAPPRCRPGLPGEVKLYALEAGSSTTPEISVVFIVPSRMTIGESNVQNFSLARGTADLSAKPHQSPDPSIWPRHRPSALDVSINQHEPHESTINIYTNTRGRLHPELAALHLGRLSAPHHFLTTIAPSIPSQCPLATLHRSRHLGQPSTATPSFPKRPLCLSFFFLPLTPPSAFPQTL